MKKTHLWNQNVIYCMQITHVFSKKGIFRGSFEVVDEMHHLRPLDSRPYHVIDGSNEADELNLLP